MQRSTLKIAVRNLGRNKRRTMLAVGAIALGQMALMSVNGLMTGSFDQIMRTITGPLVGHAQIHQADWPEERAVDLYVDHAAEVIARVKGLDEVDAVYPRIYGPCLSASGEPSEEPADAEPAVIVGVDVATDSAQGGVLEGADCTLVPGERSVIVGKVLATRLGVKKGELIALIGQDAYGFPVSDLFTIIGIINSPLEIVKTMGVVMPIGDAGELLGLPDQVHEIVVQGKDPDKVEELAGSLRALDLGKDVEVQTWRDALPMFVRMIEMKDWFDLIFLAIVFFAAAAGIANTSVMSTFERTHEFGMLLAVGSAPGRIVRMVVTESVVLGLLGVLIGSILGAIVIGITSQTGIDYAALGGSSAEDIGMNGVSFSFVVYPRFQLRQVLLGALAAALTCVLASLWPAMLASRLEPVEAMRS